MMKGNFKKTWELLLRGKTDKVPRPRLDLITRTDKLTLLGIRLEINPTYWSTQFEYLPSAASSSLHILRICKFYKYSIGDLDLLKCIHIYICHRSEGLCLFIANTLLG